MFQKLYRRISGSILPRSDRPWSEDATSNAPTIGRKRRLSDTEEDGEEQVAKRARGEGEASEREDSPAQVSAEETKEVTEVTQGVGEVELEDGKPESVPLPVTPPPEVEEVEAETKEDVAEAPELPADTPVDAAAAPPSESTEDSAAIEPITPEPVPSEPIISETAPPAEPSTESDAIAPKRLSPRRTRKLPVKAAQPGSKSVKKAVEAIESRGQTPDEVVELKQDEGSVAA